MLNRVNALGPPLNDSRAGSRKGVRGVGEQRGDLGRDGGAFVVEHDPDTKVLQLGVARRLPATLPHDAARLPSSVQD